MGGAGWGGQGMSSPWTDEKKLSDLGSMVWEYLFFTYGHWILFYY